MDYPQLNSSMILCKQPVSTSVIHTFVNKSLSYSVYQNSRLIHRTQSDYFLPSRDTQRGYLQPKMCNSSRLLASWGGVPPSQTARKLSPGWKTG